MATTFTALSPFSGIIKSTGVSEFNLLDADFTSLVVTSSVLPAAYTTLLTSRLQAIVAALPVKSAVQTGFAGLVRGLFSLRQCEPSNSVANPAHFLFAMPFGTSSLFNPYMNGAGGEPTAFSLTPNGGMQNITAVLVRSVVQAYTPPFVPFSATWETGVGSFAGTNINIVGLPSGESLIIFGATGDPSLLAADGSTITPTGTLPYTILHFLFDRQMVAFSDDPTLVLFVSKDESNVRHATIYNASTGLWTAVTPPPVAVVGGPLVAIPGTDQILALQAQSTATYIYDRSADTWTLSGARSTNRLGYGIFALGNGKVLIVGGDNNGPPLATTELYTIAGGTWAAGPAMAQANEIGDGGEQFCCQLADSRVMVIGKNLTGGAWEDPTLSQIYDPVTNTWATQQQIGDASNAFGGVNPIGLPNGDVILYVGTDQTATARTWRWVSDGETWEAIDNPLESRAGTYSAIYSDAGTGYFILIGDSVSSPVSVAVLTGVQT